VLKAKLCKEYDVEINKIVNLYDWMEVNGYLPTSNSISYKFCPQVFTKAYVQAWQNLDRPVYLIIEEINRGNCAQIFGDLFQLLDRCDDGFSEYPIKADKDVADYLKDVLGADHDGIKGGELRLPSNLIIYATMNTSDQSLFPMDSAFKRRWDWEYVPIEYEAVKSDGKPNESYNYIITIDDEHKYRWVDFLKIVNKYIYDTTHSEDKQMGNFFIKKSVSAQEFINKVMFYLWNEVCKEEAGTSRNFFRVAVEANNDGKEFKFVDLFDKANTNNLLIGFMSHLKVGKYTE
jgi:5-methylcytosine-specific restriction endonuclease McrBC GTP-binding regulatory subunit McrB